ncbi:MAG: site-2 protease family protein [Synechococcales cyanobacterium RM1_1_8]|nr:site-2 protease family protein [Synechococcales cyanobacterium RM1_1_8]
MQSGLRIGSIFGIPLQIHASWLVVVGLITLSNGLEWQTSYPQWGQPLAWGIGLASALLLFGSVLLHELGHSLVALWQGIKVNSITLFLFGGMASIEKESKTPGQAFQVAIAGPAVSILLALLLFGLLPLLPPTGPLAVLAADLARINLVLALFNLIPGLPLDGGQVLKAAVWKITGDRFQGIRWAARAGAFLGWTAVLLAFAGVFLLNAPGLLWIGLLGWFGIQNARRYDQMATLQERLLQLKASDAMTRGFRVVDADLSLEEFTETYLIPAKSPVYFAAADGRYCGLVEADAMQDIERSEWPRQPVRSLTKPLPEIASVTEGESLARVIQRLDAEALGFITVLTPAGAVAGVVDRGDLVRTIGLSLGLRFAPEEIARIKAEGDYPPGLQLGAIAQAIEP